MKHINKKFFVIGYNKTATTTISSIFENNNLKVGVGFDNMAAGVATQFAIAKRGVPDFRWGPPPDCLLDDKAQQVHDDPHIYKFEEYLEKCIDSSFDPIFILNTRPLNKWLISRFKHALRSKCPNWACCCHQGERKAKRWIKARKNHYLNVLDFFANDSQRLIIVNIEKPKWIDFLCEALEFKNNNIKSKNITPSMNDGTVQKIKEIHRIMDSTFKNLKYTEEQRKEILLDDSKDYLNIYKNNIL